MKSNIWELEQKQKELEQLQSSFVMNEYDVTHQSKYISLMSSMSHTYGNVLAFMQKWIMDLFPKDMFKTIHVNSKIAHRQLKSTEHEYIKKMKPMIILQSQKKKIER